MTTQLHDTGEKFIMDEAFGSGTGATSVSIGLFNDATDGLSDSSDVSNITTEPGGSNYGRQSATLGSDFTVQDNGSNWEAIMADQTFDTSNSSQSIDAYFVVVNFQSDDTGDSSATDHLLFTGSLDQTYDLGSVDSFTLSGSGISIN
ncbi:hypothetical protein HRTV-25_gp6 [Halorubrum tailed virus 25]|uniref:Uncharacterized protein n=1 Tax=Halorubrum tailed virus 25 TaxID=2878006 RepID=A0AAE8XYI2_9CAUD|nr:hypothetical protein M1M37_gp006 [Halorubrum tailed virus 25]UBF22587.1 hypothetical protein HRTV-25_gp6 [Halorubrum tailed virus 25]